MQPDEIRALRSRQTEFFRSGRTRDIEFRLEQLRLLRDILVRNESAIFAALKADLGKPGFEAYGGELGILLEECRHALGNLRAWVKPQRVVTPLSLFPSRSEILASPRGVVLVIGPWNYPFMLLLAPLIGAIAAGNCITLKPSELAPASSALISELISRAYPPEYVAVVPGGKAIGSELLAQKWDYIFFTGGPGVGRVVAEAAAKELTPYTLELGGKSPCLVAADADLDVSARRIAWAKFYNAGQSCVSPDYLLVHRSIKQPLLKLIIANIRNFFGSNPAESTDFARIINVHHFDRLEKMLQSGKLIAGGERDRDQRYIAPTILDDVKPEDPIMAGEVFGPILPVMDFDSIEDAVRLIEQHPDPLAFYLFTRSKKLERDLTQRISFGGGCINDAMIHLANPYLPFGGVGTSGVGAYHGKFSFDTFSHKKSVVSTPLFPDIRMRYQPYLDKLKLLKRLMK